MAESPTKTNPDVTKSAASSQAPMLERQTTPKPEVEPGATVVQRVVGAIGGGSPKTSPDHFASALGQMPGSRRMQAGVLRQVQRQYGNQYVGQVIQAKLTVGQPGDKYEEEADRVADAVMRMPESGTSSETGIASIQPLQIQRMCTECEEEEKEKVHPKESPGQTPTVTPALEARLSATSSSGQPLPKATRTFMESRFGKDFSGVRVHADSNTAQMNRELQAQAFTRQRDIYFGVGKYNPESSEGKWLLAHELTHVVQQSGASGSLFSSTPDIQCLVEGDVTQMSITPGWARVLTNDELEEQIRIVQSQLNTLSSDSFEYETATLNLDVLRRERSDRANISELWNVGFNPSIETRPTARNIPNLSSETLRQLTYASTILRRIEPLSQDRQNRLNQIIGRTPVYQLIQERNRKLRQIQTNRSWLEDYRRRAAAVARGEELAGGVPASQETIDDLTQEIARLTPEVERLSNNIQEAMARLGINNEEELLRQVETEFPLMWIHRATRIANAMLDENRDRTIREQERYRANWCSPHIEGLRAADRHLAQLSALVQESLQHVQMLEGISRRMMPPAGVEPVPEYESSLPDVARLPELRQQLQERRNALALERQRYGRDYPILLLENYSPGAFLQASPEQLERVTGTWLQDILDNIEETRRNIGDGRSGKIKVWHLRDIGSLTFQSLGIAEDSVLAAAVRNYIQNRESDQRALRIALGVLEVGVVILATVALGPLGGAIVGGLLSLGHLIIDVDRYIVESAASRVAMDPMIADISANEPQLMPIVLDLISLGLDAVVVIRPLRAAARTMAATRNMDEFIAAARRHLPEDAAEELINRASRRLGRTGTGRPGPYTLLVSGFEKAEQMTTTLVRTHPNLSQIRRSLRAVDTALLEATGVAGEADTVFIRVVGPDGSMFTRGVIRYHPERATLDHLYHEFNHLQDFRARRVPPTHEFRIDDARVFQQLQGEASESILEALQRRGYSSRLLSQMPIVEAGEFQARRAIAEIRNYLRDMEEFYLVRRGGRLVEAPGMGTRLDQSQRNIRSYIEQLRGLTRTGQVLRRSQQLTEAQRGAMAEYIRRFVRESFPELPEDYRRVHGGDIWTRIGLE